MLLHDLYLLSCYFEPAQAVLYEDELRARYGAAAVEGALREGLIERYCPPCARLGGQAKAYFRLSARGADLAKPVHGLSA